MVPASLIAEVMGGAMVLGTQVRSIRELARVVSGGPSEAGAANDGSAFVRCPTRDKFSGLPDRSRSDLQTANPAHAFRE
jgi:hypothetical protein